jgi:hypothetical protein
MRRPFTICASMLLTVALAPAALYAQDPAAAAPPAAATEPKLAFSTPAGLLLIQIKPDQTGVFEEMLTKLRAGLGKSTDTALKDQFNNFKVYKASEPMGAEKNALYVVLADPITGPKSEYEFFAILQKVMTPEELRAPETQEMFKKFSAAFAAPYNKLNLTPVK